MVPKTFRSRKPEQQLLRQPIIRKQSSKKTRNGAKRETLLNHPIETPQTLLEQPTPRGSLRCANGLGRNAFLENPPKRKRGRPRKNTLVATKAHSQEAASTTMLETNDAKVSLLEARVSAALEAHFPLPEAASTTMLAANVHLQEYASKIILNNVPDIVPEKPSSNEETIHEAPTLSKLKPPSRSDQFKTGGAYLKVLQGASSVLIAEIIEASYANQMIDLSSKTFAFLDSIGVDYLSLYNAVCCVIHHQCDKEALDEQKQGPAFVTKTLHNQITSTFSNVKETKFRVDTMVEDAQHELASLIASVEQREEELKKAKEEKAKGEAKLTAAQAEKVFCDAAYSKVGVELKNIANEIAKAQVVMNDIERRWNETMDGMKRAKVELLRLRI